MKHEIQDPGLQGKDMSPYLLTYLIQGLARPTRLQAGALGLRLAAVARLQGRRAVRGRPCRAREPCGAELPVPCRAVTRGGGRAGRRAGLRG